MNDQEIVRELRRSNADVANTLDEAAENLVACRDRVHGQTRRFILQLAKFLEGDAFSPFPRRRDPTRVEG